MLANESELGVWDGQLGQVAAQSVGVGVHAKANGTSEMNAGLVVMAKCRIAIVNVVGRHWTHVVNWALENQYSLVLYAGTDKMINSTSNHGIVQSSVV